MTKKYKTYDKWQAKGRQVQRGEKSTRRSKKGNALFAKNQTMPADYHPRPTFSDNSHCAEDYSDMDMAWDEDFRMAHGGFC